MQKNKNNKLPGRIRKSSMGKIFILDFDIVHFVRFLCNKQSELHSTPGWGCITKCKVRQVSIRTCMGAGRCNEVVDVADTQREENKPDVPGEEEAMALMTVAYSMMHDAARVG